MNRRRLIAGVAGAAAAAGVGTALWRRQREGTVDATTTPANLWALSFDSLAGAPVPMATYRGRRLLLNFWATWCPPCVAELPLLEAFARRHARSGWQVLGLAIDKPESVRSFLIAHQLSLPVIVSTTTALDLSRSLGNSVGALPFTVVFASNGENVAKRLGAIDAETLERWATTIR